ncbi:hypothetical protein FB563_3387 [Streptomyces puniciscabiei]|uniref:Uncharacterized protein n=1 Tax=Streptomyces puniciscabiei TaxID=164348 RepID=A0A542UH03_9ACTN|nr:hypothetical protein [Streptomyces puniciscabiei]TQK98365.1 hypothetical protein FB563_3387 [Streptomyces puniciscabiei]
MTEQDLVDASPVEEAIGRVIQLFMGVGADPDNEETGAAADQALADLDEAMTAAAGAAAKPA